MLSEMTWPRFVEWRVYSELEPWDETRADYRSASIVQILANIFRNRQSRPEPISIEEVVLKFDTREHSEAVPKKRKSWKELMAIAKEIVTGKVSES
jgi:hypothetical protein